MSAESPDSPAAVNTLQGKYVLIGMYWQKCHKKIEVIRPFANW